MFRTSRRENRSTHFPLNKTFPRENRAVYEVMRENTVQPDGPQMTIWSTRIASSKTKATDLQPEYIIRTAFPRQ